MVQNYFTFCAYSCYVRTEYLRSGSCGDTNIKLSTLFNRLFYTMLEFGVCNVGRFHPFVGHEGPYGQQRYSSTLFLISVLEWGEVPASRPGRNLPPGNNWYPLYRRLVGPQCRPGQVRKISLPPEFDPRTVQPVGSRCTDYATRPTNVKLYQ